MKAWQITEPTGPGGLRWHDIPVPEPGPGEVRVRIRAVSLNYRDLSATRRERPGNLPFPFTVCSDGAGEVDTVGAGVTLWKVGDRVTPTFFQDWPAGSMTPEVMKSALGGPVPGVLSEYAVVREGGLVRIPDHLDYAEAATLPCAALTAWHALVGQGKLKAGDTVLTLGTGGVSIFALQMAKLHGARVIITSSSDEKLARARELGADETINYKTTPDWEREVFRLTEKRGADHIIELGGAGTLQKSLDAVRYAGRISLIGVLTGFEGQVNPWPIIARSISLQGIYVGSRELFEDMNRALAHHRMQPVIDRVFPFDDAPGAFEHMANGAHFGKVVVAL
ncbi:MAG: zinc-dependent alcohol dehydrogenase family protein [Roseimicrobium sp.]